MTEKDDPHIKMFRFHLK